jgi:hypothetical protein
MIEMSGDQHPLRIAPCARQQPNRVPRTGSLWLPQLCIEPHDSTIRHALDDIHGTLLQPHTCRGLDRNAVENGGTGRQSRRLSGERIPAGKNLRTRGRKYRPRTGGEQRGGCRLVDSSRHEYDCTRLNAVDL